MVLDRLTYWSLKNRKLLAVSALALAVRLYWNLTIHPPLRYAYSDMEGYLARANLLLDASPWKPDAGMTLFPYGTHFLLALIKWLFGRDNGAAIGIAYALIGSLSVTYTYAIAERLLKRRWVLGLVALLLISYYPWISLGGYTLSEMPFALGISASAFYGLRLADEGRPLDGFWLGLSIGLGATMRPQLLASGAFFFLFALLRGRAFRGDTKALLARAAVPLALTLAFSSARLYWHTSTDPQGGRIGFISTNGPLNFAFGRCHSLGIRSTGELGVEFFGPPPFGALLSYEARHPRSPIKLDPAMGEQLRFQGYMWDAEPLYAMAKECVQRTGYLRQLYYAGTHIVLLWNYNIIWPDQAQKARFRRPMLLWCFAHSTLLLPPAAFAMLLAFRRRHDRWMLIALHVLSLLATAVIYFGDTRYRAPYDGLILLLAVKGYEVWFRWLAERVRALQRSKLAEASM